MYSSGTTGKPKSIVHSVGGTLIQHLKELQLHTNISRDDTIFYYTDAIHDLTESGNVYLANGFLLGMGKVSESKHSDKYR